jgi:hypothetical protein
MREQAQTLYTIRERLRQELGREPVLSELSEASGLTPEEIAQVEIATLRKGRAFGEMAVLDGEGAVQVSLLFSAEVDRHHRAALGDDVDAVDQRHEIRLDVVLLQTEEVAREELAIRGRELAL